MACSAPFGKMPVPRNPSPWSNPGPGIGGSCLASWGISSGSPVGTRKRRLTTTECHLTRSRSRRTAPIGSGLAITHTGCTTFDDGARLSLPILARQPDGIQIRYA